MNASRRFTTIAMKSGFAMVSAIALAAPAWADDNAETSTEVLQEMVVTATRREAAIQDIGIAVTALGSEAMEDLAITDPNDLTSVVPGFSFTDTGSPVVGLISIRGVSQNDFAGHLEAPNSFYIDEVYLPAISATSQKMFDVQRVEVLKGPQGTLFGRNATGGLLHVVTNKPTDELDGYASIAVAERDSVTFEGAVGGPLSDTVKARIAAYRSKSDGYYKNDIGPDLNEENVVAARGHIQFTPNEQLDILISADYYKLKPSTTGGAYATAGTPNADGLGVPLPGEPTSFGYTDADGDPFTGSFDEPGRVAKRMWSTTGHVSYDFGSVVLTSLTAYSEVDSDYREDNDLSPVPFTVFTQRADSTNFSQELRLSGSTDKMNWTTGVYYLDIDGTYNQGFAVQYFGAAMLADYSLSTKSWSVFGQVDYELSPTVTVVSGLRWTRDKKNYHYTQSCTNTDSTGVTLPDACGMLFAPAPGTMAEAGTINDSHAENGWSGRLELDWRPVDGLLLYGSISRGYKAFNYNAGFAGLAPVAGVRFKGEKLTAFEVGNKLDFWDRKARFNLSAFYYDYKDFQAFDQRGLNFTLYNTDATIYGADAEFTVQPGAGLTLYAGLSLLHTKVEDVPIGTGFRDRQATQSPDVTLSLMATKAFELSIGTVRATLNGVYTDEFYSQLSNAPVTLVPSNWLVNARIAYTDPRERFELAVFVKNLMDDNRKIYAFDITGAPLGLVENNYGEPRQFGVEAKVNF
ncbi:TonB-dependent receptor [Parapedomonas caeni]